MHHVRRQRDAMEIWGYCERCDHWFECPTERLVDWACPLCGLEPLRIKNRAADDGSSR